MKIFKYALNSTNTKLELPSLVKNGVVVRPSEQVISCAVQRGLPVIWYMVDEDSLPVEVEATLVPTGATLSDEYRFKKCVGTFLFNNGTFVLHAFMD
ncbi:MAG: hypothetical protein EOM85_02855 [Candidatus Moranbacteria bacterium]|nr:hypothetical protein [Candidatus Moranbacteria bacterium]